MAEENKGPKKPPKPAKPVTVEYKILAELKAIHDTLKVILKEM